MVNTYWHSDVAAHSACLDKLRGDMISPYQLRLPHLKPRHGWWIWVRFIFLRSVLGNREPGNRKGCHYASLLRSGNPCGSRIRGMIKAARQSTMQKNEPHPVDLCYFR